MDKFKLKTCNIDGLYIIEPYVHFDNRGYFLESYNKREFENLGIKTDFIQDNHSSSLCGVIRGLHFQINNPQEKLIRVINGKIYNVVVDLRIDSPTYSRWFGLELSYENKLMLYIPEGFANGFLSLSDNAEINYKVSTYYDRDNERGIIWNDPEINIDWQFEKYHIKNPIINDKDLKLPNLKDFISPFKINK